VRFETFGGKKFVAAKKRKRLKNIVEAGRIKEQEAAYPHSQPPRWANVRNRQPLSKLGFVRFVTFGGKKFATAKKRKRLKITIGL